jgi:DMSO reductase family type II enzyme chaperone
VTPAQERRSRASVRAVCHAACSELLASPHDLDPRALLAARRGGCAALPWGAALEPLVAELAGCDLDVLRRAYSAAFEVGDQGPPVPIRESLRASRPPGTREEVVRFYEFFGYAPGERFAWQPDHLSIELEFLHVLCVQEARAADDAAARPFQLAQADFTARHPAAWLPAFAADAAARSPAPYAAVTRAVAQFVAADLDWQLATLGPR